MSDQPELRQNVVSNEWVLIAPGRRRRPQQFAKSVDDKPTALKNCPFEDPQVSNQVDPLTWYSKRGKEDRAISKKDWMLQVIPNKFPAVMKHVGRTCPSPFPYGLYKHMAGVGFHEIVIPRAHSKFLWDMTAREAERVIQAYQDRVLYHRNEACLEYIFIFHNHGSRAGASVWHPHSQIIALPIVPPNVQRSISGAKLYHHEHKKCVHCEMNKWELQQKDRVIYKNKDFLVIAPYASRLAFEIRITPLRHDARFENITPAERLSLADALTTALKKLKKALKKPAYNFFVHTAPISKNGDYDFYHWHLEIYPKTSHFAGVELGTGVEVVAIAPEEAAAYLRKM
ncbi:MAG: HIT domain-containing protein [Patescibacteria group bacterium]